jgi:dCTP deaminase
VEAGFSGTLTIGAANLGPDPLEIPIGDRFCQIVFERLLSRPRGLYAERSGNYQGQRGVTLAPKRG